ncbi:LOW QUALITY PROTEIN: uncharacterized protein ACR2FA_003084 [Aphomia sociella]
MRRKSERTTGKKSKSSPEKKIEKVKRTRSRRRKQSTSSENESADEIISQEPEPVIDTDTEKKLPQTPVKADSPEEAQDQVWHVKATEGCGDMGEIQKLKICLTPPSTPERVDRSPRSKRKHSRATSSSDTPSVEGADDRKKSKHRTKRATRESRDSEKNHDSQEEQEREVNTACEDVDAQVTQSTEKVQESVPDEIPMSTTSDEPKVSDHFNESGETLKEETKGDIEQSKSSDADTTVVSPIADPTAVPLVTETAVVSPKAETTVVLAEDETNQSDVKTTNKDNSELSVSTSIDKSEILEIHAEESKCESSDNETSKSQEVSKEESMNISEDKESIEEKVSKIEEKSVNITKDTESIHQDDNKNTNKTDVVENTDVKEVERARKNSSDADVNLESSKVKHSNRELERSESTQSVQEETVQNGTAAPITINRRRRWGSRQSKLATQKSITISTDILKDIIPDVKPVEFDEVIEEKKHNKREVSEKVDRPVLPKIVIDNTENVEHVRKSKEKEEVEKDRSNLASNRKISIVKDNDSIIARPPSPPRHKQSCILYITNLVRPFTLQQLKNLLQRTGRIKENGFWIDRIKSKCFVKYETEEQAVETRHALHGVTWPVSNPKTLQVDFSNQEAFDKAFSSNEDADNNQPSKLGTVEDWLREQDIKRERGEMEKPWERKAAMREWDVGKGEKDKEKDIKLRKDDRPQEKRRHHSPERSPEPARKFKKKEEEAPAKLLDDLFRKTKTTPCIYWLPLSAETIAIKEEQRRQHMAEHERRLQEIRRNHRRH